MPPVPILSPSDVIKVFQRLEKTEGVSTPR